MEKERLIALVARAKGNDPQALNDLFAETYHDVYYFARKTVKDETLAADVTQDTFITIFENIDGLNDPVAYPAWSRQITYRHCLQHIKKQDREVVVEEDEDGSSIFDTVQEDRTEFIPDEALDQEDFKKTILEMVDNLPEEQRTAIILYYYDELPVKQIAEIQGVTEGTVKSRLNYGRKAIKSSVETYEKKNNVKLHSVALLPLLLWLFRYEARSCMMPATAVKTVTEGISATTGTTLSVSTAASKGAKVVWSLWQKIAIGVVVGTVAVGVGMAIVNKHDPVQPQPDHGVNQGLVQRPAIPEPTDTDGSVTRELPLSSVVSYEDEEYRLAITGVKYVGEYPNGQLEVHYTVENNTNTDIEISPWHCFINGLPCFVTGWDAVPAGQSVNSCFAFPGTALQANHTQEVGEGKLVININGGSTEKKCGVELCFTIDENYTQPMYIDGQVVYERNGLKIVAQGLYTQLGGVYGYRNHMRFHVENTTDRVYYIDIDPVASSNDTHAQSVIRSEHFVDAGKQAYIYVNMREILAQHDLESAAFSVTLYEEELFTFAEDSDSLSPLPAGARDFFRYKVDSFVTGQLSLEPFSIKE